MAAEQASECNFNYFSFFCFFCSSEFERTRKRKHMSFPTGEQVEPSGLLFIDPESN